MLDDRVIPAPCPRQNSACRANWAHLPRVALERDLSTLYLEEYLAPGATHRPMYDAEGNYPWHQFETITPSIFMAVELLPPEALPLLEEVN